jgi:hypothetical protein
MTHRGSIHERNGYVIHTHLDYPPIPVRDYDWHAVLKDYDGAPDSCDGFDNYYGPATPNTVVGTGRTEEGAIRDLLDKLEELAEEERQQTTWDGDRS